MSSAARLLQRPADGLALLDGMCHTIEAQLASLTALPGGAGSAAVSELLLTLEQRCKLEEQLLFPALYEAHGGRRWIFDAEEKELGALRELAEQAGNSRADLQRQRALLLALEGITMLHFDAIDRLVSQHGSKLDRRALGEQMQGLLQRWQQELHESGDIEDEERDPVGLPPR